MPAQISEIGRAFYTYGDTGPNLRRQLFNGDGTAMDLGVMPNVAEVMIRIGRQSWDFYYSPMGLLIPEDACIVEDQAVPDSVGWVQWEPNGLIEVGTFLYQFVVTHASGQIQSVPPDTYETLIVRPKAGGLP